MTASCTAAALSWRIYAAPFPNAFIIPVVSAARFQPRSSSSFYLLASPIPLRLFPSCPLPLAFAELSASYFTQHATLCSLSLPSKSFSFLPRLPFAPATRQCFLLVFRIHVLLSASSSFFFTSSYSGAALFGLGHKQPRIGTTL